jgi:uncharacterized SAM-binding protein YcdF (DUF218 family)
MQEIDKYAKIIWDYMVLNQELEKTDLILVCGNDDDMTSEHALELFNLGFAPFLLISGSGGIKNREGFQENEAYRIANFLTKNGVSSDSIIIEDKARSTGDNANFSRELLKEKNINPEKIILITKPYMERRAYATFSKQWIGPKYFVSSKDISYEDYCMHFPDKEHFINLMVGDLIRIKEYPKLGFQIEQEIPEEVWQAGQELIKLGYNKHTVL